MKKTNEVLQPEINIGLVGHVDHGKTTILERLSGKWADTHSEEIKRGITIRLGYANTTIYQCPKCKELPYTTQEKCQKCKSKSSPVRSISFIDAPGHETLMATMLSGAAIMDAALLLIAANEECPQPQTKEHLTALSMIGIKNIIIIQNKIDLATEDQLKKNYNQIKNFVKGTIAEKAIIIPISAQHNANIDILVNAIQEEFKTPKRDPKKVPLMLIARSFDVNKPGTEIQQLIGGVIGGSLKQGVIKIKDKIEIKPGIKSEKDGKITYIPIQTEVVNINSGSNKLNEARPGGSIAILTKLDPSIVKSDSLSGGLVSHPGGLPETRIELLLKPELLERVVGSGEEAKVTSIKKGEPLMLNVNATATIGVVTELKKDLIRVKLKRPICAFKEDRITLSRLLGSKFRLIGIGSIA
ncbi:MAG: translation initiation factor IF-2 subunit gamma [Nanoarchaeota archaeon]